MQEYRDMNGEYMDLNYIDIGVNLMGKQFEADRDQVVRESVEAGVGLVITGTDYKSDRAAVDYMKRRQPEKVWCTCGIHPHNADSWNTDYQHKLQDLIQQNRNSVVALGEVGLDYDRMFSTRENQKKCFGDILNLAEEWDLPLFLHERAAEQDFVKLLKEHRALCKRSVVHCFTGTKETAYRYLQLGCYIGITGWICDSRRNKAVIEAVKNIPLERLMIETDAPILTPRTIEGLDRRNVPRNIKYVAETIAAIKGVEVQRVQSLTLENSLNFFALRDRNKN